MIQTGKQICHVDTCTRPGCSQQAGCQGHAMRELAPEYFAEQANALAAEAARHGVTLTFTHGAQPAALGGVPQGLHMSDEQRAAVREIAARLTATVDGPVSDPQAWAAAAALLETWADRAPPSAARSFALTDEDLFELAEEAGIVTGENLRRDGYMLCRSVGEVVNVRSDHLFAFARAAMLSAAPAQDAPSAQDALAAKVAPNMQAAVDALADEAIARHDATRKLAAFGAWCAREFRDSLADVDGGSAQDAMERFGVIVKSTVTEPCGEGCVCLDYGEFPHECYKFPADVLAAMQGGESEGEAAR